MPDDPETPPETKLTRTKQAWAQAGKFITGRVARPESERLPPGQHLVKDWPVLDLGLQPAIALSSWTLDIDGLVDHSAPSSTSRTPSPRPASSCCTAMTATPPI